MGAGIAAVAGIENEPSSHGADIEEAQAELRQELTGRNECRRELEFLEKGGDPLEFKFGEALPGLWSLSSTDPLVKHIISSDGRTDNIDKREDNADDIQEDGLDSKRARGLSGKFCYQDLSTTSISAEKTLSDGLPATVSSLAEQDRKDFQKKELDASKNNRVAVKGQYARRNRQRSNRFNNGLAASRDLGKIGTEGGSISSSTIEGNTASDAEAKDVTKETPAEHVTTNESTPQTRSSDAEVCVAKGQERVSSALDLPEAATIVQASSTHEHVIESQASEALVPETTREATAAEENEGAKRLEQSLPIDSEDKRDRSSFLLPPSAGEGQGPLLPGPGDAQAKKPEDMESFLGSFPVGRKEDVVDVTESSSNSKLETSCKVDQSEGLAAGSDKAQVLAERLVLNDQASPTKHRSMDVIRTVPGSECTEPVNSETIAVVESVSPERQLRPDSSDPEKTFQAKDENSLEKETNKSLEKEINTSDFHDHAQPGEVKVKVEDEAPNVSRILPLSVSNSQEVATLPVEQRVDPRLDPVCAGAESDARLYDTNSTQNDKLPALSMPENKGDLSSSDVLKDTSVPAAQMTNKTSAAPEVEVCKDSERESADRAKGKSFQEAPQKLSHWDFVLQEMAWLANDFMQERLWKIAAAAQLARWVIEEKQQLEFEEMEAHNRQRKLAQGLARAVKKYWQSVETLLKEGTGPDSFSIDEAMKAETGIKTAKPISSSAQFRPVQAYAIRFLKDISENQAEAPSTPDRVSEFGIFDFWDEQFSEESLFYTVPQNAMEVYRQSVVSHWEGEYEQRLQEHEATMAEIEPHGAGEATEYPSGTYGVGSFVSPLLTGKRSSGILGGNQTNRGSIPTKRMRTSAVAARQRAAGGTGPLVSIPIAHLARSDISSCETNSQQDEMTGLLEGSSVSGRATDVDSNGAFARNSMAVDGVDSPFKSKKKKKTRHLLGGHAGLARDSEQLWHQNTHRQSEQKELLKQKGDQAGLGSSGLEGVGANTGIYHGSTSVTSSANKLIKQIASRDRNRKYKAGKASSSQPGVGIPWSPVEDQAILGLVHELGLNWELVSDILSATSQIRGIFRKPKDCKERYRMLTDRGGGDGGDSPDDPSSSFHHSFSLTHKGGSRYLPQHLEETLKSHVDCILQLHQQLRSRKLQSESQEPKQLVPEHESHGIKHTAMTPLELCELSSASGELVSHSYPLQPAHGNGLGIPSMLPSGVGMRTTSSAVPALQGVSNLQMSPSLSPSAALNAAATRDAQRMGMPVRPTAAEERLRYSRMVSGRGLQTQGLSVTSGSALANMPNTTDGTAPSLPSANTAGMMCSLSRGMPVTRTGLPGVGPIGAPNVSTGMNNTLSSVGMGLSGAVNAAAVSPPVNMMRRPREAISMAHSPSAALNNVSNNLPNPVVSSPTQSFGGQQQLLQHNTLQAQQSPSSSQQQAYNMMRVAKERQQLQQQQQKRMLQQQQSPTSNALQSSFQCSQPLPAAQQQHGLTHAHLFSQHQPSHLMLQPHTLQEQQQHAAPPSNIPQSAVSPSGQPSLSGSSQASQQQQSLPQPHPPTSTASPSQSPFQPKHQNPTLKHQQHVKSIKGIGRGEGQPNMLPVQVSAQISGQSMSQGQRMGDSQGPLPQHSGGGSSAQNISANLSQTLDAGAQQQFSQKVFSPHLSGKHISPQHMAPMSNSSSAQPASPPTAAGAPQQQPSPSQVGSLPSTHQQQRRPGAQSQGQQRRPQPSQVGMGLGTQLASQSAKPGLQASSVPSQLSAGFQLGSNSNSPLSMASPSSSVPLSSPSNTNSGGFSSAQWKPGQTFTPMAAGLYNLSRSNTGIAAQAPHLAMSVGMHLPLPNGKIPVAGNSLVTQEMGRTGSQHVPGHVGGLPQKAPAGPGVNSRPVGVPQHIAPSQRQLVQQQQLSCTPSGTGGQQLRPPSSGTPPASE